MRAAHSLVLTAALGFFAVPARAAVSTVQGVTRLLQKYNAEERKLADAGQQSPNELMKHWQRLGIIRAGLAKLDAHGALKRLNPNQRIALRHELAELLGSAADVTSIKGSAVVTDRFVQADELRKRVLAEIAAIADRSLEFDLHEILGIKVDTGGT
jgi:hypothetical protein